MVDLKLVNAGSVYTEGAGLCGNDCNARCKSRHPGGDGSCNYAIKPPMCTCNYPCGPTPVPPIIRKCNGGQGVCSAACRDNCCNQKCAKAYKQGIGFCTDIGNNSLCNCQYVC
ncbi:defensin-like protein 183 [Rutidosis leptorrhynchoides]|uniref:defensin-like protein 183 n=1 Tax=Rutidosis leptorrhynchoides TaxID=125765 RepID=UPI003A993D57